MEKGYASNRLKKIGNEIADSVEKDIEKAGKNLGSVIISDASTWLMEKYEKWKKDRNAKFQYKELQKYIEANDRTVQIGMDKKEIAVMWAMRELGYSQEKTQEILDLANKAYSPRGER